MHVLNIVTSPRKERSASRALVDTFLREYMARAENIAVDILDVWQECLPEFDAETINAKYKGVSGEPMTPSEITAWQKIRELASRFQRADRIVMGVPMWNFSFPYKLKQLIDLSSQPGIPRLHLLGLANFKIAGDIGISETTIRPIAAIRCGS